MSQAGELVPDGRTSVLVLEANDIQLSNAFVGFDAFKQAIAERDDKPDIVVTATGDLVVL